MKQKLRYKGKITLFGKHSLGLILPSDLVKALNLEKDEEVYIECEEDSKEIKVVRK